MYTSIGPSLWGHNNFDENQKLIIEMLNFKFPSIIINKFTIYHWFSYNYIAGPRFPIFNYWWTEDLKYPQLSRHKLKKIFITFVKSCNSELKEISNYNDKILHVHNCFKKSDIMNNYQKLIAQKNKK